MIGYRVGSGPREGNVNIVGEGSAISEVAVSNSGGADRGRIQCEFEDDNVGD